MLSAAEPGSQSGYLKGAPGAEATPVSCRNYMLLATRWSTLLAVRIPNKEAVLVFCGVVMCSLRSAGGRSRQHDPKNGVGSIDLAAGRFE